MPSREHPQYPDYLIARREDLELVPTPETELSFVVPNAVNPYREALLAGGISNTDPATVEKKEVAVDLARMLEDAIPLHRSAGREDWARALEAIRGDIRMTPEKRRILEQEIADGAIVIPMPGRDTQLATTSEQYQTTFTPIWIKDSTVQPQGDAYLWDYIKELIDNRDPSLIAGIPERPYVMLIKPTQAPEARTCKKTVDQQKAEVVKMNQERTTQGQAPVASAKPAEFGVVQQFFTHSVQAEAPGGTLTTLQPLDSVTYSRFIDLPVSAVGSVPSGCFGLGSRRLGFGEGGARWADPGGGVRLLVRVEI